MSHVLFSLLTEITENDFNEEFDTAYEDSDQSSEPEEDQQSDNDQEDEEWLDDDMIFNEDDEDDGDDMEMDPSQTKPKKDLTSEKEKSSLTERLEIAMSSLVTVFPDTDLNFLVCFKKALSGFVCKHFFRNPIFD